MVPIKREPLTAFVSDTVAVPAEAMERGGGASGCYRPSGFISVPEGRREDTYIHIRNREREARGRSNDTGYRVFHKDSMKIARDFITGEMSVNKNEYADRASKRWYGGVGKKREGPFFLSATRSSSWILRHRLSMAGDSKARFRVGRVNFVV